MKTKRNKPSAARAPKRLPRRGEAGINTSDIAPLSADFFAQAVRNPFYRPIKRSTTVRIDADVLGWLKAQGPGYQTRINALLRKAMSRSAKE
ncbi:MAG: BrnA antitoxin family protein [Gammaproteobacteria bacterium]